MDLVSSGMLWHAHYLHELVIHLRKQITKSKPVLVYPDPLSIVLRLINAIRHPGCCSIGRFNSLASQVLINVQPGRYCIHFDSIVCTPTQVNTTQDKALS